MQFVGGTGILVATFINAYRAPRRVHHGPVYLEVRPLWSSSQGGRRQLSIEVFNAGCVPVTVEQVGFKLRDQRSVLAFVPVQPGAILPKLLKPGASLTAIAPAGTDNDPAMKDVFSAFVRTAAGSEFASMSPVLQDVSHKASAVGAHA